MPTTKDRYVLDIDTKGATSALKGLKTALIAVGAAIVTKEIIDVTARFEDLQTSLNTVTKSAEAGAQAFKFINKFATQSQFGVEDLTKTYIQLRAAGIEPTEKLLRTFTDAAAVTTDQLGSLEAITALLSRTTGGGLGLEELERLADRGIPVYRILQDEIGITRQEISEFGQTAEGARKLVDALLNGIDREFGGATEARLNNLSTIISNFKIAVTNLAFEFGSGLAPAIKEITRDITQFIETNKGIANVIGEGIGNAILVVRDGIKLLIEEIGLFDPGNLEQAIGKLFIGLAAFIDAFIAGVQAVLTGFANINNAIVKTQAALGKGVLLDPGQTRQTAITALEEQTISLQNKIDELSKPRRGLGALFDFGPTTGDDVQDLLVLDPLIAQLNETKNKITALKDDTVPVLQLMQTEFENNTNEAETFTGQIRKLGNEMIEAGKRAKKVGEFDLSGVEDYDDAILRIARSQKAAIETAKDLTIETKAETFVDGWKKAFDEFKTAATNAADFAGRMFSKSVQGMEDAIVNFAKTGKFEWKEFVLGIQEELLRANIKQVIVNTLKEGGNLTDVMKQFGSISGGAISIPQTELNLLEKLGSMGQFNPLSASINQQQQPVTTNVTYNIDAVDAMSFKTLVARDPEFIHAVAEAGARMSPGRR